MKNKSWLRPILPQLLLSLLTGFLCNMSAIGLMATSAYLVTSAALQVPLYALSLAITGVRTCGIFRAVFRYAERYVSHNMAFTAWGQLRVKVYQSVMRALPFSDELLHNGDVFKTVIEALDDLRDAVIRLVLPPLGGLLMSIALFLFLLPYSKTAAVIFAAAFFTIVLVIPYIFYPRREYSATSLQTDLYEFIDGAADMAAFNYTQQRVELSCSKIENEANKEQHISFYTTLAETAAQIIAGAATVVILAIFIKSLTTMTAVQAAVLLLAAMAAFEVLVPLANLGGQWEKAEKAVKRLKTLLQAHNNELPEPINFIPSDDAILTVKDLSFSFKEKALYHNLNLSLKRGQKIALIGTSGSGKSTLVNLLTRLLVYEKGGIFWHKHIYNELTEEQVRAKIRAALQEQYIFDMTIRENFQMLYPGIGDKKIYEVLQSAGLAEFIAQNKLGLDICTGRSGRYLSGGQRVRLILALALAGNNELLILDEPTAGLDALSAGAVIKTIMQLSDDKTVLVITHDLSQIEKFDKLFILQEGIIAEAGTPSQLAAKNGIFAKMLSCRNIV